MKRLPLFLALLPFTASALDVTVTWTHPTSREDDTPLALSEIASTKIEWGLCSTATYPSSVTVLAPATLKLLTGLSSGLYCFRAYTIDTDGLMSDPTGVVQKNLKAKPRPPGWK